MAASPAGVGRWGCSGFWGFDRVSGAKVAGKIAGAPISWGVCEVPGWGHQLGPDRVLAEMRLAGLAGTELGPPGYLPEPVRQLGFHGLRCAGAFAPVLLHDADHDFVDDIAGRLDLLEACGEGVLVVAAVAGQRGYDSSFSLDDGQWDTLLANLDRLAAVAARRGVPAVLHPHVGTVIETPDDVQRLLSGSAVALCLDTGHLVIGGTDPASLARAVPDRIAHVHLKDVDPALAARVRSGELSYTQAVAQGLYTPLGLGSVDVDAIVTALRDNGFDGWYVLEQDTMLSAEPVDEGPVRDVIASVTHLQNVFARMPV
ncbi:MAG: TIM barrel protein [Mycobacteriaceae bacterium]|nr:TIM barrel protein [Mycobacteriaceae bacterium]